jgi:hypothetical protein
VNELFLVVISLSFSPSPWVSQLSATRAKREKGGKYLRDCSTVYASLIDSSFDTETEGFLIGVYLTGNFDSL